MDIRFHAAVPAYTRPPWVLASEIFRPHKLQQHHESKADTLRKSNEATIRAKIPTMPHNLKSSTASSSQATGPVPSGINAGQMGYQRRTSCGQGQDRTVDLPLFRRTLVPTELPDLSGPDGT
jgi:hypothetical protein